MSDQRIETLRSAWERAIDKDKPQDAIKALLELETLEPKEASWSHRLGDSYRRVGKSKDAAQAFARAMDRYHARGFLPKAIAMAKLASSLDATLTGLVERLTPEPAKVARPPLVVAPPVVKPAPLARAADSAPDEVRFADSEPSSISFGLDDVNVDEVTEGAPPAPSPAVAPEPSIDRLSAMVGFRLFSDLTRDALIALAEAAEVAEFGPGDTVFLRDDPASALFAIVEGTARVEVRGSPAIRLGVGDVFGEGCLLDEGKRQANVRAEAQLIALRIGKSALDAIASQHPALGHALFELLARRLISNLLQTSELFRSFDPAQRLELAQTFEVRRAEAGTVLAERGLRSDGLYVLLAGDVVADSSSGETRIARGATFGQRSLVGGAPSDVTVRARTEAVFLRLPATKFASLAALYPPVLAHLVETADRPIEASVMMELPVDLKR